MKLKKTARLMVLLLSFANVAISQTARAWTDIPDSDRSSAELKYRNVGGCAQKAREFVVRELTVSDQTLLAYTLSSQVESGNPDTYSVVTQEETSFPRKHTVQFGAPDSCSNPVEKTVTFARSRVYSSNDSAVSIGEIEKAASQCHVVITLMAVNQRWFTGRDITMTFVANDVGEGSEMSCFEPFLQNHGFDWMG